MQDWKNRASSRVCEFLEDMRLQMKLIQEKIEKGDCHMLEVADHLIDKLLNSDVAIRMFRYNQEEAAEKCVWG